MPDTLKKYVNALPISCTDNASTTNGRQLILMYSITKKTPMSLTVARDAWT